MTEKTVDRWGAFEKVRGGLPRLSGGQSNPMLRKVRRYTQFYAYVSPGIGLQHRNRRYYRYPAEGYQQRVGVVQVQFID